MKSRIALIIAAFLIGASLPVQPAFTASDDTYRPLRENMVKYQIQGRGIRDKAVLAAMNEVPRHLFVPNKLRYRAYNDYPLPIGLGQTISQPYIVAFMTELLQLNGSEKVFELGTGSGYQAAVASRVAKEVFTVEIYSELARSAAKRLNAIDYKNIHVRDGDGYYGWESEAPFDAIIVTAAADHIPPPLIEQLAPGGRLVIPLGGPFSVQQLILVTKDRKGKVMEKPIIPVRFVPLLGH